MTGSAIIRRILKDSALYASLIGVVNAFAVRATTPETIELGNLFVAVVFGFVVVVGIVRAHGQRQ